MESLGQGSTFKELSRNKLGTIKIPSPPIEYQIKISTFLDYESGRINTLLKKKEKQIELLQEKRQAIITQAVTKGLDPNVPMKDSGVEWLGKIPKHWEIKKLKHLIKQPLQYGIGEVADQTNTDYPRYIRITDIDESGKLKDDTFRSLPEEIAKPYILKRGDILFARSGATVGKSFFYHDDWGRCCYAGYLVRARLNENKVQSDFVNFYINSRVYWDWISVSIIQSTIQNVNAEKYANLVIGIPSKKEQKKIVEFINYEIKKIDRLNEKIRRGIDLLKEYHSALITAAVTGKIDVRDFVPEAAEKAENLK